MGLLLSSLRPLTTLSQVRTYDDIKLHFDTFANSIRLPKYNLI